MPEISRFYGMIVKMYFQQREHNPPHVHVLYGDYMGAIEIETLKMSEGDLPPKALAMVREWITENRDELLEMWETRIMKIQIVLGYAILSELLIEGEDM